MSEDAWIGDMRETGRREDGILQRGELECLTESSWSFGCSLKMLKDVLQVLSEASRASKFSMTGTRGGWQTCSATRRALREGC